MKKTVSPSRVRGVINAPTSKSFAQRAIAAALLSEGVSTLQNMELCNDTSAAIDVAVRLGAKIDVKDREYIIRGGLNPLSTEINIGESGLSTRLFTPIAALCNRKITVSGHGSILSRPLGMMQEPLEQLGVKVETNNGFLPISVHGTMRGGKANVDGSMSSQFITGLLMALPTVKQDSILHVENLNSKPYIDMTIEVAKGFGVEIAHNQYREFNIKGGQKYQPTQYNVEGDWSGASCILVAGAVAGSVVVRNLNPCSMQADLTIMVALERAGANIMVGGNIFTVTKGELKGFDFDATHCPDLFPALVALAANCKGRTTLTGTSRLTNKESDRAKTLAEVFEKLGILIDISQDNLMIVYGGTIHGATVYSHNDHRIAMAAAVAALNADAPVSIEGAEAVDKSYPNFWRDLELITNN